MSSRILQTINERAPLIGGVIAVIQDRQIPFLAAGLAFYAVLAIFPAVAATIAVFGLVASPTDAERLVTDVLSIAPGDASSLLTSQLSSLTEASGTGLGVSAVISTVLLLWSASAGMQAMIRSINLVHGADSDRSGVQLRAVSLAATAGIIMAFTAVFALVGFLPTLVPEAWRVAVEWLRWPLLAALGFFAIAALYHLAPTEKQTTGWLGSSAGAGVALVTWLAASFGFTFYLRWVGSINETYGTFGAAVVLLLWLYLTAFALLLGAAVDHAAEELDRTPVGAGS